jgi:hypothetical protein
LDRALASTPDRLPGAVLGDGHIRAMAPRPPRAFKDNAQARTKLAQHKQPHHSKQAAQACSTPGCRVLYGASQRNLMRETGDDPPLPAASDWGRGVITGPVRSRRPGPMARKDGAGALKHFPAASAGLLGALQQGVFDRGDVEFERCHPFEYAFARHQIRLRCAVEQPSLFLAEPVRELFHSLVHAHQPRTCTVQPQDRTSTESSRPSTDQRSDCASAVRQDDSEGISDWHCMLVIRAVASPTALDAAPPGANQICPAPRMA